MPLALRNDIGSKHAVLAGSVGTRHIARYSIAEARAKTVEPMPKPDRGARRLRLLALLFLLLGSLGLVGQFAAYPYRTTVTVSELTRDWDGFLVGDFSRPWPFRVSKWALDGYAVTLPDGTELERYESRGDLALADSGSGFLIDRPKIILRLDGPTRAVPDDTVLSVTLPTQMRDIFYQLPLGFAAILFLI